LFNRTDNETNMNTPTHNPHLRPLKERRRLRDRLHVNIYVLPNLLTTINMFFGFYAIIHAIMGDYVMAAYAIVGASVFDALDGRVARMTKSTSEFGAEYDSLCDLVSFCMAPAVLLFLWALQPFGRIGWLASFFFVACGALRLARFNVQKTVLNKAYFQGLPTPMAAGIVASAVLAFTDLNYEASRSYSLLAITFLLGCVMVSTFPYRSFKDLDFKKRLPFKYLVFGVGLIAIIAMRPEVMLFVTFLTYAVLGAVFGILRLGRRPKMLTDKGQHTDDDNDGDTESEADAALEDALDDDEDDDGYRH
jgi:CDP-diacylglycerol--serine O-phosphatidyltransferase